MLSLFLLSFLIWRVLVHFISKLNFLIGGCFTLLVFFTTHLYAFLSSLRLFSKGRLELADVFKLNIRYRLLVAWLLCLLFLTFQIILNNLFAFLTVVEHSMSFSENYLISPFFLRDFKQFKVYHYAYIFRHVYCFSLTHTGFQFPFFQLIIQYCKTVLFL